MHDDLWHDGLAARGRRRACAVGMRRDAEVARERVDGPGVGAPVAAAVGDAAHNNNVHKDACWGRCGSCAHAVLQLRSAYLLHSTDSTDTHASTTPPACSAAPAVHNRPPPPATWLGSGV